MNSGLIAARYAKALLALVNNHGSADAVYAQCRTILSSMGKLPKFRLAITDARAVALEQKCELLRAAVAPEVLCQELLSLLTLMQKNGRSEFYRLVLLDFINLYRRERNIVMVQLTTADDSVGDVERIEKLVECKYGKKAVVRHKIDSSIIGGFILESWGYRLDASVRRSLDELRKELARINRRLV